MVTEYQKCVEFYLKALSMVRSATKPGEYLFPSFSVALSHELLTKNIYTACISPQMIDLGNIRDVMEAASHFFDGADGQLDAHSSVVDWFTSGI